MLPVFLSKNGKFFVVLGGLRGVVSPGILGNFDILNMVIVNLRHIPNIYQHNIFDSMAQFFDLYGIFEVPT